MFRKILNIIFYILMTTLFLIWIIDYSNVILKKDPLFCVQYKKNKYDDGYTNICNGVGYKVIKYNRKSLTKGYTYGSLLLKEIGADINE